MKTKINTLRCIALITLFAAAVTLFALAMPDRLAASNSTQHHTYRLIDLGTLGGPRSYDSENGPEDQIINDAGVVGFGADTAVPDPFAPNCFVDCFLSHATRWENGVLTDLGALPGFGNSSASAGINAPGWIIGESENGEIDPFSGLPEIRSVLWRNGEVIDL